MPQILFASLAAALLAQLIKPLIKANGLNWSWRSLTAYSGLPSSHAAMVVCLAVGICLKEGFASPLFALAAVLVVLVIRDALGLRNYVGRHGKILNRLAGSLRDRAADFPLEEKVGHTPGQILAGAVLGFLVSLAAYYLF